MYRLYHYTLCPFSRAVRINLVEKGIQFTAILENYWEKREAFLRINKSGTVPFLAKKATQDDLDNGISHLLLSGVNAINEYLEEIVDDSQLIFGTIEQRAEIRRLSDWCNIKFYNEVVSYILHEKVLGFHKNRELPDMQIMNIASQNLLTHLDYFGYLISHHGWLASRKISLADVSLAASISVLDYLGMMPWSKITDGNKKYIKDWYALIKSRPSFRGILQDSVPGFTPPTYYRELDF